MNATANAQQFSLVKGADRYLVRCSPGREEEVIAQLMAWADNDEFDFDWFDAAVLARQITHQAFSRVFGETAES